MPDGVLALLDAAPALPAVSGGAGAPTVPIPAQGAFAISLASVLAQFAVAAGDGVEGAGQGQPAGSGVTSPDQAGIVAGPTSIANDRPDTQATALATFRPALTVGSGLATCSDAAATALIPSILPVPQPMGPSNSNAPAGTIPASTTAMPRPAPRPAALPAMLPQSDAAPAASITLPDAPAPAATPGAYSATEPDTGAGDAATTDAAPGVPVTLGSEAAPRPPPATPLPVQSATGYAQGQAVTTLPMASVAVVSQHAVSAASAPAATPVTTIPVASTLGTAGGAPPPVAPEAGGTPTTLQAQSPMPPPPVQAVAPQAVVAAPGPDMATPRAMVAPSVAKLSGTVSRAVAARQTPGSCAVPDLPATATPDTPAPMMILSPSGEPPALPDPTGNSAASLSAGGGAIDPPPAANSGTSAPVAPLPAVPPQPHPIPTADSAMVAPMFADLAAVPTASPSLGPVVSAVASETQAALTPPATAAPVLAPTTASATPPVPPSPHLAPAAQLAPALLTLASTASGSQHMTLRLQPADLGTVQVRIDRPADAPVRVEVSVSRPETLTLMVRDQSQLQRALDQAGVPQDGRSVTFQLAGQDDGSLPRHPNDPPQPDAHRASTRNDGIPDDAPESDAARITTPAAPLVWRRTGLDITA